MSSLPRYMRGVGWVVFTLMWIPFTLMLFFMPGEDPSEPASAMLVIFRTITIAMSILAIGLIFGSMAVGWLFECMVLSRGESGVARIVSIQPTNMHVNRSYYGMRFTLEVQSFDKPFQADAERLIPLHEMKKYQTGMMVNVKYDPTAKLVAMAD